MNYLVNDTASPRALRTRQLILRLVAIALACASTHLSRATSWADEPTPIASAPAHKVGVEFLPRPNGAEARILAALDQQTSVKFLDQPLQDVVNDLASLHGIEIQLDDKALDDAGIARDTPITLPHSKGISFRSVLDLLRRKYGVHYLIVDEILLVTSKEVVEAEENLVLKIYPVGDLLEKQDIDSLIKVIVASIAPQSWKADRTVKAVPLQLAVNSLFAQAAAGGTGNGVIVKFSGNLIVVQTREVHDKILELLRSLRATSKTSPALENRK